MPSQLARLNVCMRARERRVINHLIDSETERAHNCWITVKFHQIVGSISCLLSDFLDRKIGLLGNFEILFWDLKMSACVGSGQAFKTHSENLFLSRKKDTLKSFTVSSCRNLLSSNFKTQITRKWNKMYIHTYSTERNNGKFSEHKIHIYILSSIKPWRRPTWAHWARTKTLR